MLEKKNNLIVYQKGNSFVMRRTVETVMDSEEFVRLCNSAQDRESEAESVLKESQERLKLLKEDHKNIFRLQAAAQALRNGDVAKAKIEVAQYEAKMRRKGK